MVPACGAPNRLECASRAAYLHDLFLASDTTVAMLSDVPNSGAADAPVPFPDQLGTQQLAAQLTHGGAPRVLVHNVIAPNFGDLHERLDEMEATARTGKVAAFKVYTAWGPNGRGFSLDDPAIGLPVIQKAHDLGVKILVAHKGLPLVRFDAAHNRPDDIVAVSRLFPDMQFVVFHGAWDKNHVEGAYDPNATIGIDTFLRALDDHAVPPNDNVWVDVGTVWREVLRDPTTAAHTLGKLLKRVGEHRVLWGTDAIWYGSPQAQLQAFRAFTISNEFQDRFGYPGAHRHGQGAGARAQRGASSSTSTCTRRAARWRTIRSRPPRDDRRAPPRRGRAPGGVPRPTVRRRAGRCCNGSRRPRPAGRRSDRVSGATRYRRRNNAYATGPARIGSQYDASR